MMSDALFVLLALFTFLLCFALYTYCNFISWIFFCVARLANVHEVGQSACSLHLPCINTCQVSKSHCLLERRTMTKRRAGSGSGSGTKSRQNRGMCMPSSTDTLWGPDAGTVHCFSGSTRKQYSVYQQMKQ